MAQFGKFKLFYLLVNDLILRFLPERIASISRDSVLRANYAGKWLMLRVLIKLWSYLEPHRKRQLYALLVLMLLASVAEMFSIGALIPFLTVLSSPEQAISQPMLLRFAEWLEVTDSRQLLTALSLGFGVAALISGLVRVLLIYANSRLSYSIGAELSARIYLNTLYQPYIKHLNRNSSDIVVGITSKTNNVINGVLVPVLIIVSSILLLITITCMLIYINPMITASAVVGFGSIYVSMTYFMRKGLQRNSTCIASESVKVVRCLQEGLGGIREVQLEGSQNQYCDEYRKADRAMRKAQGSNVFISQFPRYAMEGLGLFMIAIFASVQSQHVGGLNGLLPTLGALALGASRLLPVLQHAYGSWANIQGSIAELHDVLELLHNEQMHHDDESSIPSLFTSQITLKQVEFSYGSESVLRNVSLSIKKGDCVGIVGRSGSGKSTLVDIIMALLEPTAGVVEVDGIPLTRGNVRTWQKHIAHVPQTIYLIDSNIADNIVFGLFGAAPSTHDIYQAAVAAGLDDLVGCTDDLFRVQVGERGARISGGQRQRIAIARALVRKADVIVFDEATSALDEKTEAEIVAMLHRFDKNKTIVMISHRMAALKHCNRIFRVDAGQVIEDVRPAATNDSLSIY